MTTVKIYDSDERIKHPCEWCTGNSATRHPIEDRLLTSEEWCKEMDTCAATIDWYKVYNR